MRRLEEECLPLSSATRFRVCTAAAYVVLLVILVEINGITPRARYQGVVYSATSPSQSSVTGLVIGANADLSYPIYLDSEPCTYSDLVACGAGTTAGTTCCDALSDPSASGPESSVPTSELFLISFFLPAAILVLRVCLVGSRSRENSSCASWYERRAGLQRLVPWKHVVGFHSFDALLGLLAETVLNGLVVEIIKISIGMPRVNYYALQYFAAESAASEGKRDGWAHSSVTSFCSGHSSYSMGACVYLVLILWADFRGYKERMRGRHTAWTPILVSLVPLSLLCMVVGFAFVGLSRIWDYWHR
jgi:hypothetical protein